MKKFLILISTILAICTAGLAGCNMNKADNNTVPENIQRIVQDEQPDPDCKDGDCEDDGCNDNDCPDDINELPVPLPHFRGRRGPRRGHEPRPLPCPMPRQRR